MSLSDNDRWLLSYYRSSEINGALFFGRVARTIRGPLQKDVTHHFADEANHAHHWTRCIDELDSTPLPLARGYQDQYLEAVGLPANLMEIMAITQVFEKRVIGQYRRHLRFPGTHPAVRRTIETIMIDERWHIHYVREALAAMAGEYGEAEIARTLDRFAAADRDVYAKTLAEYGDRVAFLGGWECDGPEHEAPKVDPEVHGRTPAGAPPSGPRLDGGGPGHREAGRRWTP